MITKILVAVSETSADTVLESAVEAARTYGARLVALHVVDPTPCFTAAADFHCGAILDVLEANGRDTVQRMTNFLEEAECPGEARMLTLPMASMTVGRAIASLADETGAELIIVGARKPRWPWWLAEDVAADIRRGTDTPIQVVPRMPAVTPMCGRRGVAAARKFSRYA